MVECVSQKERKKGRKERKKEKSALPVGFKPTPLAIRASALPPCYGRARNICISYIHMTKVQHQPCNQQDMDRSHKLEYFKKVTAPELATNSPTVPQFLEMINKRAADLLSMCTVCKDTDVLQRIYQHLGVALNNTRSSLKRKASNEHSKTQPRYYSTQKLHHSV